MEVIKRKKVKTKTVKEKKNIEVEVTKEKKLDNKIVKNI